MADYADNSILIEQARRLTLLVGNYSRERFHHPGPAYLYVQAAGESAFWSVLHLVPTAWNGQLLAMFIFNGLAASSVVATSARWAASWRHRGPAALAALAVVLAFAARHPSAFSLNWMPYLYVPTYLAFLVAVASVAAGRPRDSWLAALAGWFLMEGHVCFLLFVPLLGAVAVALAVVTARDRGRWREPRAWLPPAVISAVLALPVAVNLALHWPGPFGQYLAYAGSAQAGVHGARAVAGYALWFWWPHPHAWAVALGLSVVAAGVTWRARPGPLRRFLAALLAVNAVSSVAFLAYVRVAVDEPGEHYIGYFYWSAPAVTVLVIALGGTALVAARDWRSPLGQAAPIALPLVAALAAATAFALAPQARVSTDRTDPIDSATGPNTDPAVPAAVRVLRAASGGKTIVLRTAQSAWPEMPALLVAAERSGVRACAGDVGWEFMVTSQFVCSPREVRNGVPYVLRLPGAVPPGSSVVVRLRRAVVTGGAK